MSTQCLQTAGNNVKLFTCVFDSDDLGAELEAPPPWACRIHKEVHRLGAPRETAQARERARGCVGPRTAEGFFWAGEGEVAGGEIRCILQFEPIKSAVSRGLSPMRAGRGRKRSLKLVTQSPCHALPNFATM